MKVTRAQATANRERVIETASQLFREKGFNGIGLNELMQAAGLTRGGFYGQFDSKQDLAVHASHTALSDTLQRWENIAAQASPDTLEQLTRFYLSDEHHHNPAQGCAFAALGSDVARQHSPELHQVFSDGMEAFLQVLQQCVTGNTPQQKRQQAMATLATLVGALILSRTVKDPILSAELRKAATSQILHRYEEDKSAINRI
ncbi:TetR/AcrR family transcriptional regulator [Chromatiaceae bacterium AAb-1]|nr:TetR/AcrR family transcriptional regulator [Chromatiaceae bacterium AAb-1]